MGKLHELLAVEQDLAGAYKKILDESANTFKNKADFFYGFVRSLEWIEEGHEKEEYPPENKSMDTTVHERLEYQSDFIIRYLDAVFQKEMTNRKACSDIVIDDEVIASDVPATFLLGLESKLKQVRDVFVKIPTLPPSIEWKLDESKGSDVFSRVNPEQQFKTEKRFKPQVLYKATKEHPAQVEKISETVNVGLYTKHMWCGMFTGKAKSDLLGRVDKLIRAVKKARQRANCETVIDGVVGKTLLDYIHNG